MYFTSGYATASGFNAVARSKTLRERLGPAGMELIEAMHCFIEPTKPQGIKLHLLLRSAPQKSKDDGSPWAKQVSKPKRADEFDASRLKVDPDLTAIFVLLPGDKGYLLQCLEHLEYKFFRHLQGGVQIQANNMFDRLKQFDCPVPHPMTPLLVENTFSNIEEAAIQFAMHCHQSHMEQQMQLDMWQAVPHHGLVYDVDGIVVVALKFRDSKKLATHDYESTFKLPEYSQIQMIYHTPRTDPKTGKNFERKQVGFAAGAALGDFLHADAYIIVMNKASSDMRKDCILVKDAGTDPRIPFLVYCSIKPNDYTYRAQMITADNMRKPENAHWKHLILNQFHKRSPRRNVYTAFIDNLPED